MGFVAPHPPFVCPPRFYDMYAGSDIDLPRVPEGHIESQHPSTRRFRQARGFEIPPAVLREVRRSYYGLTSFLDERIGDLVAALEGTGQLEDTVVVYTADHGEMLGEHGLWHKCCFYEQSARVPLILRWPCRFPAACRVRPAVSLLDLTATLVDLASAPDLPADAAPWDGRSLAGLASGAPTDWPDSVSSEFYANLSTAPMAMLRKGRYKLNAYHGEKPKLFDLESDPREMTDLAASLPEVREELMAALLHRWDPVVLERRVRASQAERRYLAPYLFGYLRPPLGDG